MDMIFYLIIFILFLLILVSLNIARNYRKKLYDIIGSKNSPLKYIELKELSDDFEVNIYGPTLKSEISFIGRGNFIVPGGASDAETWILSVLAKKSEIMFEFGTCTGKTAYHLARNSKPSAKVHTLTLPPQKADIIYKDEIGDSKIGLKNAKDESIFENFLYTGSEYESKINQIFCDSKDFDTQVIENIVDLIFIDGSHTYSYVKNDTERALKMLSPNGIILWHDYKNSENTKDVWNYINNLSKSMNIYRISGTNFAVYSPKINI
jgi:hypothetical protein